MIVVDASVIVELLARTARAAAIEERLFAPGEVLHAPHLLDVEVAQVFRRLVLVGAADVDAAGKALAELAALPLVRHAHDPLLPRVWSLRDNLTAYDAVYVALAEALDATLLTCDARLSRAPGVAAHVEVA